MIDPVLLQQIINGLSLGAMYALLALGFTLVYGILELINFAHFNVFMISSFIGMWALEAFGLSGQSTVLSGFALLGVLAFAFFVTMLSAGVLGVAIERIALRPLRNVRGPAAMITTIGVSYILFNVILLTAGASSFNFPNPMPVVRWDIAGATLQLREVLIWSIALLLMIALHLFVNRLCRALAKIAGFLNLLPQEYVFLADPKGHRTQAIAHSPVRDHVASQTGRLLQVAFGARVGLTVDQSIGGPAAHDGDELGLEVVHAVVEALLLGNV